MQATLRLIRVGNQEGIQKIQDLQNNILERYESVFARLPDNSRSVYRERISGIGLITKDDGAILAAFCSAEIPLGLLNTFGGQSFLQNMTEHHGAIHLYAKDPSIRTRIKSILCTKYPCLGTNVQIFSDIIDGKCGIMPMRYPDPLNTGGSDSPSRKKEFMNTFEDVLFQEMKAYIFSTVP